MAKVFAVNSVDYSKLCFNKPVKGSDNKYFVAAYVRDDEDSPAYELLVQMKTWLTNGLCDAETGDVHLSTDVRLDNPQLVDFVRETDDQMLGLCKQHKGDWFPSQELTDSYLENAFMPSLKAIKKSHDQLLKVRPSKHLQAFNSEREALEFPEINPESQVSVIISPAGLWFTKTRFGITWKLRQVKVVTPKKPPKEYLFDDAADDEDLDNVFPDP